MASNRWSGTVRRRDRLRIIADILQITMNSAIKTQIICKANLSSALLKKYLSFLLEKQLIKGTRKNRKSIAYKTTPRGHHFLKNYIEIMEIIEESKAENKKSHGYNGSNSFINMFKNTNSSICAVKHYIL